MTLPPQPPWKTSPRCSAGSSVLWRSPTSPERARPPFGLSPSRTGLDLFDQDVQEMLAVEEACQLSASFPAFVVRTAKTNCRTRRRDELSENDHPIHGELPFIDRIISPSCLLTNAGKLV